MSLHRNFLDEYRAKDRNLPDEYRVKGFVKDRSASRDVSNLNSFGKLTPNQSKNADGGAIITSGIELIDISRFRFPARYVKSRLLALKR